jgi:HEPN domain-containing protein
MVVPLDEPEFTRRREERLSRHYIPARYPDAHGRGTAAAHYGRADADAAVADATIILNLVDEQWQTLRA